MVGSWPGASFATNDFVRLFCQALTDAGVEVIDVTDPRRIARPIQLLHIHWPEQLLWRGGGVVRAAARALATLHALVQLRRRGVKLVWMVHNLRPHDLPSRMRPVWSLIAAVLPRIVQGYLTLSPATRPPVVATHPALAGKPFLAARQPAYPAARAPVRDDARATLGIAADATMFAMVGFLRPYKGAEELIGVFRAVAGSSRRLLIAGSGRADYVGRLRMLARGDDRITIRDEPLDDDALSSATVAADCIVAPFRNYLHSGSLVHALCLGRPVITPAAPFADDLAQAVGEHWVARYDGALPPALLERFVPPPGRPDLAAFDGLAIGRSVRTFYQALVERPS